MEQSDYFEDHLDILRRYRNEEFLRIGLNDIHGRLLQGEVTSQLSLLGEACLAAAFRLAVAELHRFGHPTWQREGAVAEANLAIIALGKLGGRELNYHSDLDIIFRLRPPGSIPTAKNRSPIMNILPSWPRRSSRS